MTGSRSGTRSGMASGSASGSGSLVGSGMGTANGSDSAIRMAMGTPINASLFSHIDHTSLPIMEQDDDDESRNPSEITKGTFPFVYGEGEKKEDEQEGNEEMIRINPKVVSGLDIGGSGAGHGVELEKGIVKGEPLSTNSDDSMMVHSHQTGTHTSGSVGG